ARGGQILINQRVYVALEELLDAEPLGELSLKGFLQPVPVFNVRALKEPGA
ncbi:MAG: Guanylate cyclase, partial [Dehalococcoidia bacterium]|nr:Guanylate cyclase [Dehalococcoidia bacterium]